MKSMASNTPVAWRGRITRNVNLVLPDRPACRRTTLRLNAKLKTVLRVLSEHRLLTVQTARAGRLRRSILNDLWRALAVGAAHRECVPALLKRPVIAPDHPRQARQRRAQLRLAPLTSVHLNFNLRDAPRACMRDA